MDSGGANSGILIPLADGTPRGFGVPACRYLANQVAASALTPACSQCRSIIVSVTPLWPVVLS